MVYGHGGYIRTSETLAEKLVPPLGYPDDKALMCREGVFHLHKTLAEIWGSGYQSTTRTWSATKVFFGTAVRRNADFWKPKHTCL